MVLVVKTTTTTKKKPPANAGDIKDTDLIPGLGRSLGGGHPLKYSHQENLTDRGAWWATVHIWLQLSTHELFRTITNRM